MLQLNKVHLAGNLCADPLYKVMPEPTGHLVKFTIACNRTMKERKEVAFVDCEAWGQAALNINRYFKKGSPIYIEGRLKSDSWQTNNGEKRQKLMVTAEHWQFVESGPAPVAPAAPPAARGAALEDEPPF